MSFSVSDLSTGSFISDLSGTNGVAALFGGISLYYSATSGATWTEVLNVPNTQFSYIGISGANAVAMGSLSSSFEPTIYYSTNSGVTWNLYTSGPFSGISVTRISGSISGTNVLCIVEDTTSVVNVFFSTNGGNTWNSSQESSSPISVSSAIFIGPDISGSNAIFCIDNTTNNNIYISSDGGANFNIILSLQSSTAGFNVNSVSISGLNALIAAFNGTIGLGLIYASTNGGATWGGPVVTATNIIFFQSDINGSVGFVGGIDSGTAAAVMYSTTNSGTTWTPVTLSGTNYTNFSSISGSGINGLAAVGNVGGDGVLFITTDSGANWTQSTTLAANSINTVSLSNINGIAGTFNGIYYTSTPLCYEKNTLILVLENEEEVYKKVSELKVGDMVKTYKHGYKKIKLIKSFIYNTTNITRLKRCMYKMIDHDVVVTGKHGILVDELSEIEIKNIKKCRIIPRNIDDKQVLPACASDKFEKITDIFEFELWHFVLENDDESKNYGIYITDGILSESCSEKAFLNK